MRLAHHTPPQPTHKPIGVETVERALVSAYCPMADSGLFSKIDYVTVTCNAPSTTTTATVTLLMNHK